MINHLKEGMLGYSVKKMKSMPSRNGISWSCEIFKEGIKVAEVYDAGNGGCTDMTYFNVALELEFKKIAEFLYAETTSEADSTLAAEIADNHELINKLSRQCKKSTLYQLKEDVESGTYRKSNVLFTPSIGQQLKDKFGDTLHTIINEAI